MNFLIDQQWGLFIAIEVLSIVFLIAFGILRYGLDKRKTSSFMLWLFIVGIILEALLAFIIYTETKKVSTFHVVIGIFIVYACTFGIQDFRKLDRWMRQKIGVWRNVDLLTEKDHLILQKQKDPEYIARKYRQSSLIHLLVFLIAQSIFIMNGVDSLAELKSYLTDFTWVEEGNYKNSPYGSDLTFGIGVIWTIVFVVDILYSWSYTIFPAKRKQ